MLCNIRITTNLFLCITILAERRDIMGNILKIDKIEKYYGNKSSLTKAIDNLSFDVEKGEFVAIMGARDRKSVV